MLIFYQKIPKVNWESLLYSVGKAAYSNHQYGIFLNIPKKNFSIVKNQIDEATYYR